MTELPKTVANLSLQTGSRRTMNHIRNIKEMLNIPTGSRNAATSGYSSLTDSQLFFGSQFWLENSQGLSQDMSVSSRNSQQSSQEGSDPKFSSSYHTKPLLFGDFKDKTRTSGILDKFEEDKKKAKEKNDSDHLAKECQHIRETLSNIQQFVAGTERNAAVSQIVSEKIDNFTSMLQKHLDLLQGHVSQQFKALNEDILAELDSHLQSLKSSLEGLREVQGKQGHMLEEVLKLLSTLVSEHSAKPHTEGVMDSAIQTSPAPEESVSSILHDNKLEGAQLTSASYNLEENQGEVPRQDRSHLAGNRKFTLRHQSRLKKRPLVLSQRSKCAASDENRQPLTNYNKQLKTKSCDMSMMSSKGSVSPGSLMPLDQETRSSEAAGCFITPLSCWSQDSGSSMCPIEIEPILEKLSAEPGSPIYPGGFWQLFDSELDL